MEIRWTDYAHSRHPASKQLQQSGLMGKGFTLVEMLIVVAILGILAAVVVPQFQSNSTEAKEATAKDNLRLLRSMIEVYAAQHNDVAPGYSGGGAVNARIFVVQLITTGHYLSKMPKNPFNSQNSTLMISDGAAFPETPTGTYGWLYKPQTKEVRIDWPGADSTGKAYYDY